MLMIDNGHTQTHQRPKLQLIVDFGMTRETYGALSGLPAIPNIVFGPLGGAVVDWLGAGTYTTFLFEF